MRSKERLKGRVRSPDIDGERKEKKGLICSSGFCSPTFLGSFVVRSDAWSEAAALRTVSGSPTESKHVWSLTSDQTISGFYQRLAQSWVRGLKCTRSGTKCPVESAGYTSLWTRLALAGFYQVTEHEVSFSVFHTDRYNYYSVIRGTIYQ